MEPVGCAHLSLPHPTQSGSHRAGLERSWLQRASKALSVLRSCLGQRAGGIEEAFGKGWAWPVSLALFPGAGFSSQQCWVAPP